MPHQFRRFLKHPENFSKNAPKKVKRVILLITLIEEINLVAQFPIFIVLPKLKVYFNHFISAATL